MGPCWATIYAETLKTVEQKYTETAGAVLVMSIIGGAVVPAVQGYVSDITGSLQFSFIVNFLCFAYVGYYFLSKMRETKHMDEGVSEEDIVGQH
jgi:FHS family L-fucose permease-like MFS transporter